MSIRNPNDPAGMDSFYGTFLDGQSPLSEWGNSVNKTLDDSISLSKTPVQNIASLLTLSGLVTMGANWDIGINILSVNDGEVKDITAVSLAYLVGLDQTLKKADSPEFTNVTIGTLTGVIKGVAGDIEGVADTDDLPIGSTNLYHTDDLVNTLIKNNTGITWAYDPDAVPDPTLTPTLDDITIAQLATTTAGYIIVTDGSGVPDYVSLTVGAGIVADGTVTIADNSHTHDLAHYTKTEIDDEPPTSTAFFEGEVSGKKQVHWNNITNKPATYAPTSHNIISGHNIAATLYEGEVLKATGLSAFSFMQLQHNELSGVTDNLHHNKAHAITVDHGATDLTYSQLSNQVDFIGAGSPNALTYAYHAHEGGSGSSMVNWANILNPPATMPPTTHNHSVIMGWNASTIYARAYPSVFRTVYDTQGYVEFWDSYDSSDWVEFYLPNNANGKIVTNIWFQVWFTNYAIISMTSAIAYSVVSGNGSSTTYKFNDTFHYPSSQDEMFVNTNNFTMTDKHQFYLRLWTNNNQKWRINAIYVEFYDFTND